MKEAKTMRSNPPSSEGPVQSFETALSRLGDIVDRLEGGELPLEESLKLFEEGVRLARTAEARLNGAERRVEELLGMDDDGNPIVRELGDDAG